MESLGFEMLSLFKNIILWTVPVAAIVVLAPRILPPTLVYFREIAPWQRLLLACFLLLVMFQGVTMQGIFGPVLAVLPNSVAIVVLFTLAPTLCIAIACKHARICHPGEAVALLGLPVGVMVSILCIIGIMSDLTGEPTIGPAMALLPAVVGGLASVFCYSWTKKSWQLADKSSLSTQARLVVFLSFFTVFVCSSTIITKSLGAALSDFPGLFGHPLSSMIFVSILTLLAVINDDSEELLLRVSNACLVTFGLAVALGTISFYASQKDAATLGIGLAFSLLLMFYSTSLYIGLVIWTMLNKQLRPNMFALKNWHLAEMFTIWVFALMSPPSLWEAMAAFSEEGEKTEQMEVRISELEDRLATLSSQDSVYVQPLDN